jgi:hypothetical protein
MSVKSTAIFDTERNWFTPSNFRISFLKLNQRFSTNSLFSKLNVFENERVLKSIKNITQHEQNIPKGNEGVSYQKVYFNDNQFWPKKFKNRSSLLEDFYQRKHFFGVFDNSKFGQVD